MTITLPFASPSQNATSRWTWHRVTRHRDAVCWIVRQALAERGVSAPWARIRPGERRKDAPILGVAGRRVTIEVKRFNSGELDLGNLIGGCKHIVDALVIEGLIFDDSPKWLTATYTQHPAKRGQGRTEIEIQ